MVLHGNVKQGKKCDFDLGGGLSWCFGDRPTKWPIAKKNSIKTCTHN
jgi:hypothetical protein